MTKSEHTAAILEALLYDVDNITPGLEEYVSQIVEDRGEADTFSAVWVRSLARLKESAEAARADLKTPPRAIPLKE